MFIRDARPHLVVNERQRRDRQTDESYDDEQSTFLLPQPDCFIYRRDRPDPIPGRIRAKCTALRGLIPIR